MQIMVVGCGKVGKSLVDALATDDNNVIVIDTNPDVIKEITNSYDVLGVVGNGTSSEILESAGLANTDMLIAVTQSDEVNLLTCVIAKKKTDCHTIARVRNPIYSRERDFLRSGLQLSMTINPELVAAREIASLLALPGAIDLESLGRERFKLMRFRVPDKSILVGRPLGESSSFLKQTVLFCVVEHSEDELVIPNGDTVIQKGDVLTAICGQGEERDFLKEIGIPLPQVKSVIIVGGSRLTYYLTTMLEKQGMDVTIIEINREKCENLSEKFPNVNVVCGDGTSREVLDEEDLDNMDALVACTGIDEVNAILASYAQNHVHTKVVTKINHIDENDVIDVLNLDSVVNPKNLTAQRIIQFVRATKNSMDSNVESLYRFYRGRVEVLEFSIREKASTSIVGRLLQDMPIRDDTLVGAIIRNKRLIIPGGQDQILVGDRVVIVTTHIGMDDITDILKE